MTEDQADRASGSLPHAYRNRIFWNWAPAMPAGLSSSFVTVLYALGTAADTAGLVRFKNDGKAIRIKDIAAACKADEKDVRRYLEAAIAAGVVAVEGERRRGRAAVYVLILEPRPDWGAAVDVLATTKRKRAERKPPPWRVDDVPGADENGGRSPELPEGENGGPPPELPPIHHEEERGTAPRMGSGDRPPFGSGDRPPNNPGSTKELPHETAEVVGQPQVDGAPVLHKIDSREEQTPPDGHVDDEPPLAFTRCAVCHERMVPRPGRTTHKHCTPAPVRQEGTAS
ncbi:hypothetical protein ACFO9E_13400 [Streptomyces maoxianensis]|uniref:Helix-turn-helix domain-containing protein n=1 Tax=Streptomyces maoxianensis TaxID=1459942 RepID=A0ABV9G7B7_9ACTN